MGDERFEREKVVLEPALSRGRPSEDRCLDT